MVAVTSDASCYFLKSEFKDWILEVTKELSATEELIGSMGRKVGLEFGVLDMLKLR